VKYDGEDSRLDTMQVFKEGEHIWQKSVEVSPSYHLDVDLSKMLLIDIYAYTENYNVVSGIYGANVYINERWMGKTGRSGLFGHRYENESGVDGELILRIEYPEGFYPEEEERSFFIQDDLQRLTYSGFSYNRQAPAPRVTVIPPQIGDGRNALLSRRAYDLKRGLEDYLTLGGIFSTVSDKNIANLFEQFDLNISKSGMDWSEIPFLKNEVEGIIFGNLSSLGNDFLVELYGIDYTGKIIGQMERRVSLRGFQSIPELFVEQFRSNFPYEGTISAIDKKIHVNLGTHHGVEVDDKFYSFLIYYDTIKQDYSKKRVAKLRITDVMGSASLGELESISEGYLLEPGGKVKRFSEPAQALKELPITIQVMSGRDRVSGANIYLDDQWTGQTDDEGILQLLLTESATADVLVYKEGYIPAKIDIKVQEDESSYRVNLKQGQTQFTIDSEPRGALLFVNGEFMGNTPVVQNPIELPYGFHRIELKLDGYKDYNQYLKFSERRVSLTDDEVVVLHEDFLGQAEDAYEDEKIDEALKILMEVPESHPDYKKSMEFCGYIYLRHYREYEASITCYSRAIDLKKVSTEASVISYYNYGQACYNRAEELYYESSLRSQSYYQLALEIFNVVKERRSRLLSSGRKHIYQDVLFYVAVSHQKLYYLTNLREFLSKAHYSWIDYFDFFDNNLFRDSYYENQYRIAESYREEIKRLQNEE
jgi:tetratricopeptide (TPR) repeat protein